MDDGKRQFRTYCIDHRTAQGEIIKSYVGVTIRSLERRLSAHLREASRAKRSISLYSLGHAIREELRGGAGNSGRFSIRELGVHQSQAEMLEHEALWIEKVGTMAPNGYNLMPGGSSAGGLGNTKPVELFVDGALMSFKSIAEAAYALATAANIDPAKFQARAYSRIDNGWTVAEAFDLEPHEDGRTTERSRKAAAEGRLLATVRSKDYRDLLKTKQPKIRKGSLLPHPTEEGRMVTIDQFIKISELPKSTVTHRLKRIWPIEKLAREEVIKKLTTKEDRRRIFEFMHDGKLVREGVNELAARFETPGGNTRAAIKKRLNSLADTAGQTEILQAVGLLERPSKRHLVPAKPVSSKRIHLADWSVAYGSQYVKLPRQMDFVRWLLSFLHPSLEGEEKRDAGYRLQKRVTALAKKGRKPWEIAHLLAGLELVKAPSIEPQSTPT